MNQKNNFYEFKNLSVLNGEVFSCRKQKRGYGKRYFKRKIFKHRLLKLLKSKLFKAVIVTVLILIAFLVLNAIANELRGYKAVGGEILIFLIPFLIFLAVDSWHDVIDALSKK